MAARRVCVIPIAFAVFTLLTSPTTQTLPCYRRDAPSRERWDAEASSCVEAPPPMARARWYRSLQWSPVPTESERIESLLVAALMRRNWRELLSVAQRVLAGPVSGLRRDHEALPFVGADAVAALGRLPSADLGPTRPTPGVPEGSWSPSMQERVLLNNIGVGLALRGFHRAAFQAFGAASTYPAKWPLDQAVYERHLHAFLSAYGPMEINLVNVSRSLTAQGLRQWGALAGPSIAGSIQEILAKGDPTDLLGNMAEYYPAWIASAVGGGGADVSSGYAMAFVAKGRYMRDLRGSLVPSPKANDDAAFSVDVQQASAAALADFMRRLAADEAFVDMYRIEEDSGSGIVSNYIAYVTENQSVKRLTIGSAEVVDSAVAAFEADVRSNASSTAGVRRLSRLLWTPIAEGLSDGIERVWLSADGRVGLAPWQALEIVSGAEAPRYVVMTDGAPSLGDRGRSLASGPRRGLVVGGVDYGSGPNSPIVLPLTHSEREAQDVRQALSSHGVKVATLSGRAATRAALLAELPADYVHLATHGFVRSLPSRPEILSVGPWAVLDPRVDRLANAVRRRRVDGGSRLAETSLGAIAMAGASATTPFASPGSTYVSDMDLLERDLSGTELVFLSACDVGRTVTVGHQSVLGFQGALVASGARSVVSSLWVVDDALAPAIARDFYRGLLREGASPAEALRSAQLLARRRSPAPASWAGWTLFGVGW